MNRYALIVAGGKGSRMKSDLPKQFMLLLDAPILMLTIERFASTYEDIKVVVVLPEDQFPLWRNMCSQMDFDIPHKLVAGGDTRYDSVKNGLTSCGSEGIIGIHDGVRPLVSHEMIERCYESAAEHGSALPVVQITQSLRKIEGEKSAPISRDGMVEVQTPQCFNLALLQPCYEMDASPLFTDDATVFEASGNAVHLVDGEPTNIKITTQADLKIAEAILLAERPPKKR